MTFLNQISWRKKDALQQFRECTSSQIDLSLWIRSWKKTFKVGKVQMAMELLACFAGDRIAKSVQLLRIKHFAAAIADVRYNHPSKIRDATWLKIQWNASEWDLILSNIYLFHVATLTQNYSFGFPENGTGKRKRGRKEAIPNAFSEKSNLFAN